MSRLSATDRLHAFDEEDAGVNWDAVEVGAVVVHPLRLQLKHVANSSFSDLTWSLLPMNVKHGTVRNLHWLPGPKKQRFTFPAHLIPSFKRIIWLMINRPAPDEYMAGRNGRTWPAASSIYQRWRALRHFADFLGQEGIEQLSEVSDDLLDAYSSLVISRASRASQSAKARDLGFVGSIAFLADYLPEADRMIEPSWSGKNLGGGRRPADNSKEIIHPDTFAPLIWWAQQIISCVGDVADAVRWRQEAQKIPPGQSGMRARLDVVTEIVKARGGRLPQGEAVGTVASQYLVALHGGGIHHGDFRRWQHSGEGTFTVDCQLPQPIPVEVKGLIEGKRWLPHIDFRDVDRLQRILQAAAAVMICACTGMRGEECLRLPRGALRTVPRPDGVESYRIDGRVFKAVWDTNDQQDREGKKWIWATIKPGASAFEALESLGDSVDSTTLFFRPNPWREQEMTGGMMTRWIQELIDYSNGLRSQLGIGGLPLIGSDPAGNVTLDRFRRSIAWHIVNQPEGLLAAGVQFGHMQSTTTEGYASTITSGIAATMDQERTIALYSTLQNHASAAKTGMAVSGPAAKILGDVLNRFEAKGFPGTYAELSKKDERRLRSDPDLAVRENPGHGCLCLANPLKPETMACSKENDGEPNRNDCRTYCGNRVYTDETVAEDRREVLLLRERIAEANPILAARIAKRINHLEEHIQDHTSNALPLIELMTNSSPSDHRQADAEAEGGKEA
jgi:hypothetical protein